MTKKRNHSRYTLRQGRETVHVGITNDPDRREQEHQNQFPGSKLTVDGPKVTKDSAIKWENEQRDKGRPTETPKK